MKNGSRDKREESEHRHMKRMTATVRKEISIKSPDPELPGQELVPKYVDCPVDEQTRNIVIWHAFTGERLDDVNTLSRMLYHDCSKMLHNRHVVKAKIDHLKELQVELTRNVVHALDLVWDVFSQWSDTLDAESRERCLEILAQASPPGTKIGDEVRQVIKHSKAA